MTKDVKNEDGSVTKVKENVVNVMPERCNAKGAVFVVQIGCLQDQDELDTKQYVQLGLTCSGVFMCFSFISIMFFAKKSQELACYEFDQQAVTAADYTCEMEIP